MVSNSLKFILISDLHLSHYKVSTALMVRRIILWLMSIKNLDEIRYFFITGDVFDRPGAMDSEASKHCNTLMNFVLAYCSRNNIKLRVLKGTSNHDGKQSEHFVYLNEGLTKPCDLMYLSDIVVYEEDGLRFLAVPDNMARTCAKVQSKVEKVLADAGWDYVDVALTHGMYDKHLLAGFTHDSHSYDYYASIVRILILNGHIHTGSLYGKLLTSGSFDRNRHGEEERKGGWLGEFDVSEQTFQVQFKENADAFPFITYKVESEKSVADAYTDIVEYIQEHQLSDFGRYLRIEHDAGFGYGELTQRLTSKFGEWPEYSPKKVGTDSKSATANIMELDEITTTPMTKDTLPELVNDKLKRLGVSDTSNAMQLLRSML